MTSGFPTIIETCRFLSDPRLDGRAPGTDGHEEAKQFLLSLLPRLDVEPLFDGAWTQDVFDGANVIGTNLGGIRRGSNGRSILIGAHYDHLAGIPGADDNAAAVSIVMDAMNQLAPWSGEHDLVMCFFDLEEPPYFQTSNMGSVQFVQRCPVDLSVMDCAIILDLCGHDVPIPAPGRKDAMFVMGAEYSADLVDLVRGQETPSITTCMFRNDRIGDMSDQHAFRLEQVPFLFFSCGWWEHYHAPTDTFEKLNLEKMQHFADYLTLLLRDLDKHSISRTPRETFWREEARALQRLLSIPVPQSSVAVDKALATVLTRLR